MPRKSLSWTAADRRQEGTHPKVNLQIPSAAKLPVPNLKCDRHLIIPVEGLVEAFSLMGAHLDVVSEGSGEKAQEGNHW